MILLIDTNVILDVLLNREEFVRDSSMVFKLCETKKAVDYISILSFANIMFVMRKQLSSKQIEEIFKKLSLIFNFSEINKNILEMTIKYGWSDFEDSIQAASGEIIKADYIVTRNIKDFVNSQIKAITPSQLLFKLNSFLD